jgi:hypothetical protein
MTCPHDLLERETACADGMCPLCLAADNERLQADNESLCNTLKQPDQVGYWERKHELAQAEIERLTASVKCWQGRAMNYVAEIKRLQAIAENAEALRRNLEDVSCRQQNEIDRLRAIIRQAIEAYDNGNLQMDSPEIGEPENDIPMHPWHEEWLHYARAALKDPSHDAIRQ